MTRPDVLSTGSFPPATMTELAEGFERRPLLTPVG